MLALSTATLVDQAQQLGIDLPRHPWKEPLVAAIASARTGALYGCGVLEVHGEGFGFLRSLDAHLLPSPQDIYVGQTQIRRFNLRTGDTVMGEVREPRDNERYTPLIRVHLVNGADAEATRPEPDPADVAIPSTRLPLSRDPWLEAVDAVAPLALGHRGLLVAPSGPQRTEVLRRLAEAFHAEDGFHITVLLPSERPEDITAWAEHAHLEVIATRFDEQPARQLQVFDVALERARRLAESGLEVLVLVDGLNKVLRLAQHDQATSGRVVGPADAHALQRLRGWFAFGRDLPEGGSVTLIGATDPAASVDPLAAALLQDLADASTWQAHQLPGAQAPAWCPERSFARWEDRILPRAEVKRRRTRARASEA